jgi:hypothetical protein
VEVENASQYSIGMHRMQEKELRDDEEQEKHDGTFGIA